MEKILGNYLTQGNRDFPLDCETLDALQQLSALTAVIGNIAGDRVILSGCGLSDDGTRRAAGYVFLRTKAFPDGEVLPWAGGYVADGLHIKEEPVAVRANDTDYPTAYARRSLAPGVGSDPEKLSWEMFTELKTLHELMNENRELRDKLADVATGAPVGVVQMWAGQDIPRGYLLCNGQELEQTAYPELYAALGSAFLTTSGKFKIPDLRGRFIVGLSDRDYDYAAIGATGGEKKVALSIDEMPGHNHAENFPVLDNVVLTTATNGGRSVVCSYTSGLKVIQSVNTQSAGQSQLHENRPPYYVLAYIIRAK